MNDVLTAATPLLVAVLTYAGYLARQWVKAHVAPKQYSTLTGIAQQVVLAVDQLAKGNSPTNEAKLVAAEEQFRSIVKRLGIKVTPDEVTTFIHAAVAIAHTEY